MIEVTEGTAAFGVEGSFLRRVLVADPSWYGRGVTYYLFDVIRETPKMVYGRSLRWGTGCEREDQARKSDIVLTPATHADLARIKSAAGERDRRIRDAGVWYAKRVDEILTASNTDPHPPESEVPSPDTERK